LFGKVTKEVRECALILMLIPLGKPGNAGIALNVLMASFPTADVQSRSRA
jgi:hypothetical protein